MKPRRRELTVFSMSALDLFASGMGAFILLTIMALPFFPNTGDSDEEVAKLQAELEEASDERDAARSRASSLESVLARMQQGAEVQKALEDALNEALRKLAEAEKNVRDLVEALAQAREPKPQEKEDDERERALEAALEEARKQLADAERQLSDAEAQLADAEKRLNSSKEALAKARMPNLDLVICLDVTGSMSQQIDGLKREIGVLAEILDKLSPSAGVGIVAFGDKRWRQTLWTQPIVETSSIARLQAFVNTLEPNMRDPWARRNSDYPEALATALEHATGLNWRSESERQHIVVVTDNAAYRDRERAAIGAAQRFAGQQGRQVSTVRANFVDDRRARQAADRFLRQLAVAGQGQFVDAAGGESMIGSLLLAILET